MGKSSRKKRQAGVDQAAEHEAKGQKTAGTGYMVLVLALLCIAVAAVYWQVGSFGFITMDDMLYVTHNEHVQSGLTAGGVKWAMTGACAGNWHPLTMLSLMLDRSLGGPGPAFFHTTNVLIHILNTILLVLVLFRMTGCFWRSAFVGALFALHPIHVESVAWVTERKDVLSTLFWLLTMLAYLRYTTKPNIGRYLLVAFTLALGLMSKPMVVSLPLVLLMLDFWPLHRTSANATQHPTPNAHHLPRLLLEKLPLLALAAASCAATIWAQKGANAVASLELRPLGVRVANAFVAYIGYLTKTIWPSDLGAFYPHPGNTLPAWQVIGSVLLFIVITVLALRARRSRPYITVGWLWYVVTLLPVIGLMQVGWQSMADRYTYVPLIGIFIILAWGIPDLLKHKASGKALAVPAAALVMVLSVLTYHQVGFWKDNISVWSRAAAVTKDNALAHSNLANALVGEKKWEEAIPHCEEAIRIEPDYTEAHINLAIALAGTGRTREAIEEYTKVAGYKPKDAGVRHEIGLLYAELGDQDNAVDYYRNAIELKPSFADAHYNLGLALHLRGDRAEAMSEYREALRLNPRRIEAHNNLGLLLVEQGRLDEAISHYREALRIDPNFANAQVNLQKAEEDEK